jgi:hypothetical protein
MSSAQVHYVSHKVYKLTYMFECSITSIVLVTSKSATVTSSENIARYKNNKESKNQTLISTLNTATINVTWGEKQKYQYWKLRGRV